MARIVFDLDGTLIDSAPDIRAAANVVLVAKGLPEIDLAQTRSFVGHGVSVFVRNLRNLHGVPDASHKQWLGDFLDAYRTAHDHTVLYPGVRDALELLRGQKHAMGICTNKPSGPAEAILSHLHLRDYFNVVIGGDDLPVRKPDPAPLITCLERLGEGPAVFIGDSEVDAATAEASKIPFLLYTEGYRRSPITDMHHDAAFNDFSDLPAMIADRLATVT